MTARILIVEDELAIREMLTFVMEQHGFTTSAAEDFDSAIALLKEPYPRSDFIGLDVSWRKWYSIGETLKAR